MAEGNSGPGVVNKSEECSKIKGLIEQSLSDGDTWYKSHLISHYISILTLIFIYFRYLVDIHWFNQWKKYVAWDGWDSTQIGDPSSHPGHIDNSSLINGMTMVYLVF